MKNKILALLNLLSVAAVIYINYYSVIFGINGNTVGSLSRQYDNLFTPASFAFSIWGIIFLAMAVFAIYQVVDTFFLKKNQDAYLQIGYRFLVANVCNCTWVFVWLSEYTGLSVLVMLIMLVSLLSIILQVDRRMVFSSASRNLLIWVPIMIYAGWINVAMVANVSAYLSKLGWDGGFLSEIQWAIILILTATLLNLAVLFKKGYWQFAIVGIWALFAIYSRHAASLSQIATVAALGAGAIFLSIVFLQVKRLSRSA
ncbi:MAG: tryptophan-rich sensory protein [Bacteroidota bacterium]